MSAADKKVQEEDLKKLEAEAYFELCQIIAEAMQLQNIDLLNSGIAMWKDKYKKLLDSPDSNLKKRIDYLLSNYYYLRIIRYIADQLKFKEEKKVQNQAKALKELYGMIKETNDLDLLRKKVKKWEEKYPVSGFLKMYQKRIELYTRDKNLRENAFDQEKAFADLVDITKKNLSMDELNVEIGYWEKEYSINDKYTIDDFIKHQSEVKRYTSLEFLQSIARDEPSEYLLNENTGDFSNLSLQKNAYDNLMARINGHNSIDKVFEWVYKNRYIKFNDRYKEMILSATYLDYRPQYLKQLSEPKMDMSKSSLSFEEYNNIDEIKRYAVLSYFNMLLPANMAIPNDYFEKNILTVYAKSERARVSNDIKPDLSDTLDTALMEDVLKDIAETPSKENENDNEIIIDLSNVQEILSSDLGTSQSYEYNPVSKEEIPTQVQEQEVSETHLFPEKPKQEIDSEPNLVAKENEENIEIKLTIEEPKAEINNEPTNEQTPAVDNPEIEQPEVMLNSEPNLLAKENGSEIAKPEIKEPENDISTDYSKQTEIAYKTIKENKEEKPVIQAAVITLSPLFFEAVNSYNRQADLINVIDGTVTKCIERQERQESLNFSAREKTKLE